MQRIIQCEHRVRKQNSYVMFLRKSLRQVDLFLKMPSCDVQKKKKKVEKFMIIVRGPRLEPKARRGL
jgi:hypothetical protein